MKTTTTLLLVLWVAAVQRVSAQLDVPMQPQNPSRQWTVTLKIIDETGMPVSNATAAASYILPTSIGEELRSGRVTGLTDNEGIFRATHRSSSRSLGFHVEKKGYYAIRFRYEFERGWLNESKIEIPMQTLVLKRIRNPIPMYAKWVRTGVPALGKAIGFDLQTGDWVAPHGKGIRTDIIFSASLDKRSESDLDYKLTVSFPTSGDGIQEFSTLQLKPGETGGLRSPHAAPVEGYRSEWIQTQVRRPAQPTEGNLDPNRNYFFRVRTVLDEKGNVKSAHYGKIYGDFLAFRFFLNPTPNDLNVEFDPAKNLLTNLKPVERVNEP